MVKAPARWPARPKSPCRATVEAPGGRAGILAQGQVGEAACRQPSGRCCAPARKLAFGERRGHDLRVTVFVAGMVNAGTGPRPTSKMLPIPNSCRPSLVGPVLSRIDSLQEGMARRNSRTSTSGGRSASTSSGTRTCWSSAPPSEARPSLAGETRGDEPDAACRRWDGRLTFKAQPAAVRSSSRSTAIRSEE